jgi:hypothetical protein
MKDRVETEKKVFFIGMTDSPFDTLAAFEILHINSKYLITSVKRMKLKMDILDQSCHGYNFAFKTSKIILLDEVSLPIIEQKQISFSECNHNILQISDPKLCMFHCFVNSYEGVITRIIDQRSGIFEIDGLFFLYLTWYPVNCQLGFNINCVLAMMNVHFVSYNPTLTTFIVACPSSFIRIVSFSSVASTAESAISLKTRRKCLELWRGFNFIDWIIRQNIVERLTLICARISGEYSYDQNKILLFILETCGWTPYKWSQKQGVLDHKECSICDVRYIPFLIQSVNSLEKHFCDEKKQNICIYDNWSCNVMEQYDSTFKSVILGWITCNSMGSLELQDETGKLYICILTDTQTPICFDRLCMIYSYELVVEESSMFHINSKSRFTYCRFPAKCILYLGKEILPDIDIVTKNELYFIPYVVRSRMLRGLDDIKCELCIEGYFIFSLDEKDEFQNEKSLFIRFDIFKCQDPIIRGQIYRLLVPSKSLKQEAKGTFYANGDAVIIENISSHEVSINTTINDFYKRHQDIVGCLSVSSAILYGKKNVAKGHIDVITIQGIVSSKVICSSFRSKHSKLKEKYTNFQQINGAIALPGHDFKITVSDSENQLTVVIDNSAIICKFIF